MPIKNPEERRRWNREYYAKHRVSRISFAKAYRENNKETVKQTKAQYYRKNRSKLRKQGLDQTQARKQLAADYLGGKCKRCGLVDDVIVYDFHHRDPDQKDSEICNMLYNNRRSTKLSAVIRKELDKCDLVCVICHRKIHHELATTKTNED